MMILAASNDDKYKFYIHVYVVHNMHIVKCAYA